MDWKERAEALEARIDRRAGNEKKMSERVTHIAEFVGGVAAASAYRAYLSKNKQAMPKLMGFDADTVVGVALLAAGFFEVGGGKYADHMMYLGAGLSAGAIGNKTAGLVNPAIATKGVGAYVNGFTGADEPSQIGSGHGDVSAHHGATVIEMIRRAALASLRSLQTSARFVSRFHERTVSETVLPSNQTKPKR